MILQKEQNLRGVINDTSKRAKFEGYHKRYLRKSKIWRAISVEEKEEKILIGELVSIFIKPNNNNRRLLSGYAVGLQSAQDATEDSKNSKSV